MSLEILEHSISKTNELLHNIEIELGWENHRSQSYTVLRSVLHAFRDRLSIPDAVNFSAQLPLLLKGLYFDGWQPERAPIKMSQTEFIDRVRCEILLDLEIPIADLIKIVIGQIFSLVDPLESEKIKEVLPADLNELFFSDWP